MPQSIASIVIEDYNGEKSACKPNLQDMDGAGTLFGSIAQDLDEIKDAILTVITGEVRYAQLSLKYPESASAVTDVQAAREGKWLVTYRDDTEYLDGANTINNPGYGQLFSFEIACADRTLLSNNQDEADLAEVTVWAPFVAAMEPNIRSPYNRSAGAGVTPTNTIVSVKYVGRNN